MATSPECPFEFCNLRKGMKARVTSVNDEGCECCRLMEMGLTVGTEFKVVKVAPLGDPVEIDVRGYRLCLRKGETTGFEIEQVS